MYTSAPAKLGFAAAAALGSLFLLATLLRPARPAFSSTPAPGTVVHIVLFAYTPDTTPAQKADIAGAFLGLKDACVRPGTRTPYILSVDGGPNHSPEDVGQAHEHAFVLTFATRADRDYYVDEDPAHAAFKASLAGRVAAATVADYDAAAFPPPAARAAPVHVRAV